MQIGMERAFRAAAESFEEEVSTVLRESLGLIHSTLTAQYQMGESEARELERDLAVWFERFCQRPGSPPARDCRHSLIVMTCLFARGHQRHRIEVGLRASNERLNRVLQREPVEVARDVSRGLKLLYHQLHEA